MLSLSSKFWVSKNTLLDRQLLLKHHVAAKAVPLLQPLLGMITFAELQRFSDQIQLERNELHAVLGFLNSIGALRVSRDSRLRTARVLLAHALHGIFYPPVTFRKIATSTSIAQSCIRASWPFAAASIVSILSACFSGAVALGSGLFFCAIFIITFVFSLVLHETTHSFYFKSSKTPPVVLQAGMRLTLLHQPLHWSAEIASSMAGPLAGSIACLGAAFLWQQFTNIYWQSCAIGVLSLTHMGALLPFYSDGRSIVTAFKERRCSK